MTTPALAGASAMDQAPMLRATAAAAIQRRECGEIFLTLFMFGFELKSSGMSRPMYGQNMQAHLPRQLPTRSMTPAGRVLQCCSDGEGARRAGVSGSDPMRLPTALIEGIRFAADSPLEEAGLKLLVPLRGLVPIALSKMTGKPCALRLGTSTGRVFRRWEIR
jgi:hypothetical protein